MIQSPPRKPTPRDPGPVGGAPGHLGRVRLGGALLLVAIPTRFLGTLTMLPLLSDLSGIHLGNVFFLGMSALMFSLAGGVSLSRVGWPHQPRGWGLVAAIGLFVAEVTVLFGLTQALAVKAIPSALSLLVVHPLAMAVAAGGLMGHMRALLRPGASMRRLTTGFLGMVMALLVFWAGMGAVGILLNVPLAIGLMIVGMLPLPVLAMLTSMMMMIQLGLSRAQASTAIIDALISARATDIRPTHRSDGVDFHASCRGLPVSVRLDDARLPLAVTVSVPLPPQASGLCVVKRTPGSRAPKLGNMVLDQLVAIDGLPPAEAAALLGSDHSALLEIIHGHPGSDICDGAIHLRAASGPGLKIFPGAAAGQQTALHKLIKHSVDDVLALHAVLCGPEAEAAPARPLAQLRPV